MPVQPPAPEPAKTDPGAFDPTAFAATLMEQFKAELNKGINAMDKKISKLSEQQPKPSDPKPADPPTPDPANPQDPAKPDTKSVADFNAKLALLTRQIESLTQQNEQSKKAAEEAEGKRLEAERVAAFDAVLADIPFADAKARQTFKRAYLADLVRDEDGNFVVQTEKGPMAYAEYFKAEAQSQPSMLQKEGHSGAGATGGKKAFTGPKIDILSMSSQEIAKLPEETRNALLQDAFSALPR
jgi:hypothetical protein